MPNAYGAQIIHPTHGTSLAEILERVLDKGVVIAGDISISLADIELLKIKLRLVVASVDRAKEMGIDWWESDPALSSRARHLEEQSDELLTRVRRLETALIKESESAQS